ncbi:MAG TPA: DNA-processing protein DprA [Acidimicrobiia bacterium]|nr:DNA-processing protein DprA [Acidimicrobiia bacterium]
MSPLQADSRAAADLAAATLVCLPDMGPRRLRAVLDRWPDPGAALAAVRAGEGGAALASDARLVGAAARGELVRRWASAARALDLGPELARRGTTVARDGHAGYPIAEDVPDRPAVLLVEGRTPAVLHRPRVAIVGTRSASVHGLADARELGAFLARRGVTVVSGLAIGIDGAAHEGALDAGGGVVGVVATGLDVVYPRRHVVLFERVREAGVLLSESGFGAGANRFRFPVRNRIIAALADVVVVVEATLRGGARITADYGLEYGRPVLVVPGSRRNPSAEGCNALLADGAQPLLDPDDVLVALGMTPGSRRGWGAPPPRPRPDPAGARILEACAGEAASVDQLVSRTGLAPEAVTVGLRMLQRQGWIEHRRGWWWPR